MKISNFNDIMFHMAVIKPIGDIISDLNGRFTYRVDYLNQKLESYMKVAAECSGVSPNLVRQSNAPVEKNLYAKEYFLKYFGQLLNFFQKIEK